MMKNALLAFNVLIFCVFNAKAQEKANEITEFKSASLVTKFNKENIEYKFGSLEEFNTGFDQITDELNLGIYDKNKNCELTIEFKLEFTAGVETTKLLHSITTSCKDAIAPARQLKSMLISAISQDN